MAIKLPPYDLEIEKIVLGSLIANSNSLNEVRTIINQDCFYDLFHKDVFNAIKILDDAGTAPNMMTVYNELLKKYKIEELTRFVDITACQSFDVYDLTCVLIDKAIRRKLYFVGEKINSMATDENSDIESIISYGNDEIKAVLQSNEQSVFTLDDSIKNVLEIMNKNNSNRNELTGTPTGFKELDKRGGGLQKSDLTIIAADSSQGKTAFAMSIVMNATMRGASCAIYSMEMKKEQLTARILAMQSGVSSSDIMYKRLNADQYDMIDKGIGRISGTKIYFDDRSTSNIDNIINSIRSLKLKHDIDGAVVDYIQMLSINMRGASVEQLMAECARRLKNLAKELDIWIIALSQLARNNDNPEPSLTRVRASGQINEAADNTILIYRPEIYGKFYKEPFQNVSTKGTAQIEVAKGRNIGLTKFIVNFIPELTLFKDFSDNLPTGFSQIEEDTPF